MLIPANGNEGLGEAAHVRGIDTRAHHRCTSAPREKSTLPVPLKLAAGGVHNTTSHHRAGQLAMMHSAQLVGSSDERRRRGDAGLEQQELVRVLLR